MCRVSVIIPTYNRWPMVREAVESVLAQSYQGYEVIVVDDGSDDGSVEELYKFGSKVNVLTQPRRGVAAARNHGVSRSQGSYLSFLDSDDLWRPKKLATQVAFMTANQAVEICQTDEIWIRNGARVNPKKRHQKPSGDIFRASLELCLVSPSSVMIKRELFNRMGGFDESLPVCEDYDLWLRISVDTPVLLIPEPLVIKRGGHSDQLSRSTWGLDRYRILAIEKLLHSGLGGEKRKWAIETLLVKASILAKGARRRGKEKEAQQFEKIMAGLTKERENGGSGNSRIRQAERDSDPDFGSMAPAGQT